MPAPSPRKQAFSETSPRILAQAGHQSATKSARESAITEGGLEPSDLPLSDAYEASVGSRAEI
jgi:hypothetical protein